MLRNAIGLCGGVKFPDKKRCEGLQLMLLALRGMGIKFPDKKRYEDVRLNNVISVTR